MKMPPAIAKESNNKEGTEAFEKAAVALGLLTSETVSGWG